MTTPVQFLFVALGVILAIKSFVNGAAVGSLPLGWLAADSIDDYEVKGYIWLGACLVFGLCLIFKLRMYDARHNQKRP